MLSLVLKCGGALGVEEVGQGELANSISTMLSLRKQAESQEVTTSELLRPTAVHVEVVEGVFGLGERTLRPTATLTLTLTRP